MAMAGSGAGAATTWEAVILFFTEAQTIKSVEETLDMLTTHVKTGDALDPFTSRAKTSLFAQWIAHLQSRISSLNARISIGGMKQEDKSIAIVTAVSEAFEGGSMIRNNFKHALRVAGYTGLEELIPSGALSASTQESDRDDAVPVASGGPSGAVQSAFGAPRADAAPPLSASGLGVLSGEYDAADAAPEGAGGRA